MEKIIKKSLVSILGIGILVYCNKWILIGMLDYKAEPNILINWFPNIAENENSLIPFNLITTELKEEAFCRAILGLIVGLLLSVPFIYYQIGNYIKATRSELRSINFNKVIIVSSILLYIGITLSFLFMSPIILRELLIYKTNSTITYTIGLMRFNHFMLFFVFVPGVMLHVPYLVFKLVRMKVLNSTYLTKNRKSFYLGILVLAIIISTAAFTTKVFIFILFFLLFELSILVAKLAERSQESST